jgi:phospholipid/cholesterol/gamma-HCH transport system permease protein
MKNALYHFGRYMLMLRQMFNFSEKFSIYWSDILREVISNGMSSIIIVIIMSVFIGAVTTVQTAYQLEGSFFPITTIGSVVSASALLEMAPTITSLVLAGKIGANITSQIGTMRITEQIDALEVMGINSASYLILPKTLGAMLSFPCLIIIAAFCIHLGGIIAGTASGIITHADFLYGASRFFQNFYITFMCIKAVSFGFIIATVSAYQGYYVEGGALDVGVASTRAMVYCCILLVIADYLLAKFLL